MKSIIVSALIISLNFSGFAQSEKNEIADDLVKDKEIVLAKHIPMANGQYLYKMYVIPPKKMVKKLNGFEASYKTELKKEQDAQLRELKKLDLNYYKRNVLSWYTGLYGMDSIGMVNMEKVMIDKKGDPDFGKFLMDSREKAFVKKLSVDEKKYLTDQFTNNGDISNEALFKRSAAYRKWLDSYITKQRRTKYSAENSPLGYYGDDIIKINVVNREISNPFIKEYFNYELTSKFIKGAKDENTVKEAYNNFMAIVTNTQFKNEVKELYDNYKAMAPNSPAPNFNYQNVDGKEVSLKDLRGKYVYIDVWATWCGPCKAEIPFLKEIEKDFHGKDIYFVSLSVDQLKDKQKWISYVKDNNLKGVQIMADNDFKSDFVKKFNINAIPRFILIDPEGKIVAHDAKRPSDPELRTQLESLLK